MRHTKAELQKLAWERLEALFAEIDAQPDPITDLTYERLRELRADEDRRLEQLYANDSDQ